MIDAHIHVAPPQLPGAGSLSPVLRQSVGSVAQLVRSEMAMAGITRAFAMGEWTITPDDPLGINRTLEIAAHVPGLAAIGVMDPTKDLADTEHFARVEALVRNRRVVGLKGYLGYLHFAPSHPTYRRYYEIAAQFQIPVTFHTGDTYSPYAKLKYAHPLGIDEVAVDHPETRFIIAHIGNPWTIDAAEVIYKNVNVWGELSGLFVGEAIDFVTEEHRDTMADVAERIRKAFRYAERPNRFLYGSDWPLVPMLAYREFIASILPAESHEQVFSENAARLFRML